MIQYKLKRSEKMNVSCNGYHQGKPPRVQSGASRPKRKTLKTLIAANVLFESRLENGIFLQQPSPSTTVSMIKSGMFLQQ